MHNSTPLRLAAALVRRHGSSGHHAHGHSHGSGPAAAAGRPERKPSGLQREVLALYRDFFRAIRTKPKVR